MFNDIGALELVTLVVLAVLIFGPDKLPKVIQDITGFIRKIREFSDSAKRDIREELGPEFKDFEFEDLNPKTFVRKHLDSDELGLKEIRNGFDLKKEMNEVADAVNGTESESAAAPSLTKDTPSAKDTSSAPSLSKDSAPSLTKDSGTGASKQPAEDRPPFDADAT
ncbi:Sec-independent protein translocase protein TatB [Streptomyces sp. YIM 130001]|uniref:sec-independent translocase n=1 Tax=Streptomyces sp. YIM 130001 TaxID=2259644 RepID=UPI000E650A69|nr:sec-independent translocase [Streptomyces sp. YIM 130001]RII16167.1 Sec-independent protein translocase protein TatB [Streptomyces sp. YIM 130001]